MTETRKELIDKYNWLIEEYNISNIELSTFEEEFLDDNRNVANNLFAEDGFLTDRQIETLDNIYEKYNK